MIHTGDIIEINFAAYKVLDVEEDKLKVQAQDGSVKAVSKSEDINILRSDNQ